MMQKLDEEFLAAVGMIAMHPLLKLMHAIIANDILTREQMAATLKPLLEEVKELPHPELLEPAWKELVRQFEPSVSLN